MQLSVEQEELSTHLSIHKASV